jgi:hypothetical protein
LGSESGIERSFQSIESISTFFTMGLLPMSGPLTFFRYIAKDELDWTGDKSWSTEHHDVVVIGGGKAGRYLSWDMSAVGTPTPMNERRYIGG